MLGGWILAMLSRMSRRTFAECSLLCIERTNGEKCLGKIKVKTTISCSINHKTPLNLCVLRAVTIAYVCARPTPPAQTLAASPCTGRS